MNTIERLAELAKGATQGKWRYLNSNAGYRFVLADDSDRYALAILHPDDMRATLMTDANGTYIAACNPAAIAQAAAEHAAVVAERDALKVRNGELERALREVINKRNDATIHVPEALYQCYLIAEAALTPSPQSEQEEA